MSTEYFAVAWLVEWVSMSRDSEEGLYAGRSGHRHSPAGTITYLPNCAKSLTWFDSYGL